MLWKLWDIHEKIVNSIWSDVIDNDSIMDLINKSYEILFFGIVKNCFFKDSPQIKWLDSYFFTWHDYNLWEDIKNKMLSEFWNISPNNIVELLESYHIEFKRYVYAIQNGKIERIKSKMVVKWEWSFYTPKQITGYIVKKTIENALHTWIKVSDLKILDFWCWTWRFAIDAMIYLNTEYNISYKSIIENNIYAVDIDEIALDIMKLKILLFFDKEERWILKDISRKIIKQNMLITSQFEDNVFFKNLWINVIVSNPPYFQLKVNDSKSMSQMERKINEDLKSRILQEVEYFRQCWEYKYSTWWMLNYYKLSLEKMMQILPEGWHIWIICPSTLFWDKNCTALRKYFLLDNEVSEINYYEEWAWLFEWVAQSTVVFFAKKWWHSGDIKIWAWEKSFIITLDTIFNVMWDNYEVPYIDSIWRNILKKMNKFAKIKEIPWIRNKRWELDLTLFKWCIVSNDTWYNLIRWVTIWEDWIKYDEINEYVDIESFKKQKSLEYLQYDFGRKRLICKQIANIDLEKRLHFEICKENDILWNSCNYLSIKDEKHLNWLKMLLNSYLMNRRFKITSSNNHINNYELDELPINEELIKWDIKWSDIEINLKVCKEYWLSLEECIYILQPFFTQECIEYVQKNYL